MTQQGVCKGYGREVSGKAGIVGIYEKMGSESRQAEKELVRQRSP